MSALLETRCFLQGFLTFVSSWNVPEVTCRLDLLDLGGPCGYLTAGLV